MLLPVVVLLLRLDLLPVLPMVFVWQPASVMVLVGT
jgi:hypothetical protein